MPIPQYNLLLAPFDDGSYWNKGSREGPEEILKQLFRLRPESVQANRAMGFEPKLLPNELIDLPRFNTALSFELIEKAVRKTIGQLKCPIVLGGDHSITLPILRALSSRLNSDDFYIIHLDAHSDTFPDIDGFSFHHGSVFRKAIEEKLIQPRNLYQIGLRGFCGNGWLTFAKEHGVKLIKMREFQKLNGDVNKVLPPPDKPVYISLDIDVVDPAFAPGTGTPVPGGMTSGELLSFIENLRPYSLLGVDLVEVSPNRDINNITSQLAAHFLLELFANCTFNFAK